MIESAIRQLLSEKGCVIIPGFGALMTKPRSAAIQPERQVIHPPAYEVVFNSGLTTNDGLLAQRLADLERITFVKSLNKIKATAEQWWVTLNKGESLRLQGIGEFYPVDDGLVGFTPQMLDTVRPDVYGLNSVHLTPVKRTTQTAKKSKQAKSNPAMPHKQLRPSPYVLVPVSIVITALLLSIGLNVPLYPSGNQQKGGLTTLEELSISEGQEPAKKTADRIEPATDSGSQSTEREKNVYQYHVISGSFRFEKNAQERAAKLQTLGYKPTILKSNKGFHRVSVKSFQDSSAAKALTRNFKTDAHQPNAWLLKRTKE